MMPAIIGALGSIVGGLIGSEGAEDRNAAQIAFGRETNLFNAEQAQLSRDWSAGQAQHMRNFQRSMSNTQYQRAVNDMEAAGLNPMLAYSQGGAGAPSGAMGQSSAASGAVPPHLENTMQPVMTSALQVASLMSQIEKVRAETDEIQSRTRLVDEQVTTEPVRRDFVKAQQAHSSADYNRVLEETKLVASRKGLTDEEQERVKQEVLNLMKEYELKEVLRFLHFIEAQHRDFDIPRARNEMVAEETWYGREVRPYMRDVQRGVSSGLGLRYMLDRGGLGFRGSRR